MEKDIPIIMWFILVKLENMNKWGAAHSELKRVLKSLPSQFSTNNQGKKLVEKAVKELVRKDFISIYKKTNQDHTSLNSKKAKNIKTFIDEVKKTMGGNSYVK